MTQIQAYVRTHKKDAVCDVLRGFDGISGMTIIEVQGWGRAKRHAEEQQSAEQARDFEPYLKVEVFCSDLVTDQVVDLIREAAHTGLEGDGKIYVSASDRALRISTNERGDEAC